MKQRKCKACKTTFMPARTTQTACGIDCAMQLAHEKKVKLAERYGVSRSHVSGIQAAPSGAITPCRHGPGWVRDELPQVPQANETRLRR